MPDEAFPALSAAIEAVRESIATDPDPRQAYRRATALGQLARELLDLSSIDRGAALVTILDAEGYTMAELAELMGMSKSRVSQLVTAGRAQLSRQR